MPLHAVYASVPLREQTCHVLEDTVMQLTFEIMLCKLHSPQLPRELLADGKQHGHKLVFVSDNRNQLTKLENFGEMFSFRSERETG